LIGLEVKLNEEYENADNDAFLNPEQWVHHTPYLLPQGRTEWINPFPKDEDKDDEEDGVEAEPETGPEPLTSIGMDDGKYLHAQIYSS
jgi:radial spoke head protein 4A